MTERLYDKLAVLLIGNHGGLDCVRVPSGTCFLLEGGKLTAGVAGLNKIPEFLRVLG